MEPKAQPPGSVRRRARGIPGRPERYYVPLPLWRQTWGVLRQYGIRREEAIVLWAGGWGNPDEAYVTTLVVPPQVNSYSRAVIPPGGMAVVSGAVRAHDLLVVAQVHTHPREAFHSSGDDSGAVGFSPGFLSLVVPRFGDCPSGELSRCTGYRYTGAGRWQQLTLEELRRTLILVPDFIDLR